MAMTYRYPEPPPPAGFWRAIKTLAVIALALVALSLSVGWFFARTATICAASKPATVPPGAAIAQPVEAGR